MFRPEIQALRAIAVLAVVGYHLWPAGPTGGYVGVDVFFVISGFLITGHLDREVAETGRLRLARFWARRVRRLLPAASVVLLFAVALTVAFVPHSLWQRSATEIAASALYAQNWVLAANSVDYLAADGTPTLVQHFWSLSVEEQFYLAWPVLIVVALVIRRSRRSIAIALGLVFAASLAVALLDTSQSAYFSTATRAWEFAAGGLLSLFRMSLPRPAARVASWTGLAGILVSVFAFTPDTPFPAPWALVPVAGAILVIAGRGLGFGRAVAVRPVQALGDVSYSLYLWHWPLIVAVPYALGHPLTIRDGFAILVVSIGLAALTKRFIEDSVRRAPRLSRSRAAYLVAVVCVGAVVATSGVVWTSVNVQSAQAAAAVRAAEAGPCFGAKAMVADCSKRFALPTAFDAAFWADDKGPLGSCNSDTNAVELCAYGDTTNPSHTVALVGNSHAGHLVAGLDEYGKAHGWKFVLMRKTGCAGGLTEKVVPVIKGACVTWSRNVDAALLDPANHFDTVVFASNDDADHYFASAHLSTDDSATVVDAIGHNLVSLKKKGLSVVVLGDVPGALPEVVPECVDQHARQYDPCATRRVAPPDDLVAQAASQTRGIGYVDLTPWFCSTTTCHVVIGGTLVYLDGHHLTATFSRSLGPLLGAALASKIQE